MILCTHDTIGAALSRATPGTLEHDLLTQMHADTRASGGGLFLVSDFASLADFLAVHDALVAL
jgi:hypothetical protein